jgi:2-polyprenyl-3-methyl-5-hydroxy-6-metoxy-1,4-benzoquinol methylase
LLQPVKTLPLALVLDDLKIAASRVRTVGDPPSALHKEAFHALCGVAPGIAPASAREALLEFARANSSEDGLTILFLTGDRSDGELAQWRNALWPFAHATALYRVSNNSIVRHTFGAAELLRGGCGLRGALLVARRRAAVFAPEATVEKFDKNAAGWNGEPGKPGYAHFRWMRRYVAHFAIERARARRILDFGCGAGWVGIEAARSAPQAQLCAFDPSPEMVRIAGENARASGIARFEGRTGFGEDPPFGKDGEELFDLVLSSGVISFAGDAERWLDGLARTVAPGGTLVIGDINRESRGMRARRAQKPLLPLREMNATTREEVRSALERRGFRFEAWSGYQASTPVPQLMHFDQRRLGGLASRPLLWLNMLKSRANSALGSRDISGFDSWVMRLKR